MEWKDEIRAAMTTAGIKSARALAARLDRREATVGDWLRGTAEPWDSDKATIRQQLAALREPGASVAGSAKITLTATGSISGGGFLSEDERRGYLRRTLEQAAQAIRDAQAALDTPVTSPETVALYEAALDLADPKHLQAAPTPRPAGRRR